MKNQGEKVVSFVRIWASIEGFILYVLIQGRFSFLYVGVHCMPEIVHSGNSSNSNGVVFKSKGIT